MALPDLTPEERAAVLEKAAQAKRDRKSALDDLAAGKLTLADVLAGEDPRLHKVKVHRVLVALPGVGKARADKALAVAGVAEGRRVQGLGDRQRKVLAEHFAA